MSKKEYIDKEQLFEIIYPVGSIYLSAAAVNPTDLFGIGTWEKIEDAFLLASGAYAPLGSIGGNENHTLTINEMPEHSHDFIKVVENGTARLTIPTWPESINPGEGLDDYWHIDFTHERDITNNYYPYTSWAGKIANTGGGQPFSIMPPYLSINVWKRVE